MLPPLVRRAEALAVELGLAPWPTGAGRLIHVLAGATGRRRVAAIGTGGLTGGAWLASALDPAVPLMVVEDDAAVATAATLVHADDANVRVLSDDWRELLPAEAPFDLLVAFTADGPVAPARLLAPHGVAVCLAPAEAWHADEELAVAEVLTDTHFATMVAVRRL